VLYGVLGLVSVLLGFGIYLAVLRGQALDWKARALSAERDRDAHRQTLENLHHAISKLAAADRIAAGIGPGNVLRLLRDTATVASGGAPPAELRDTEAGDDTGGGDAAADTPSERRVS